jgi:ATP-dependent Clp protease protease subunit
MINKTPVKRCCTDEEPLGLELSISEEVEEDIVKTRRIYLIGEINEGTAFYVNGHLQSFAITNPDLPVFLYISSPGGDMCAGYSIIDQILLSPFKVYTIIHGRAHSMGAIVAAYGTKKCRFITENSTAMLHSPIIFDKPNSIGEHKKTIDHIDCLHEKLIRDLSARTKLKFKNMESLIENTHWMNAKEACEIGLVDGIWTSKLEATVNLGARQWKKEKEE